MICNSSWLCKNISYPSYKTYLYLNVWSTVQLKVLNINVIHFKIQNNHCLHSRSSVLSSNTSCKTTTIKMDRPYLLLVLQMNWAVTGTGQWTHWLWFSALEDNLWCDALAADKRKTWKTVSKLYKLEIKTLKHYSNNGKFANFKDLFIIIERNFQ